MNNMSEYSVDLLCDFSLPFNTWQWNRISSPASIKPLITISSPTVTL